MAKIGRQNKEIGKIIDTSKIVNELQSDIKEMFGSVSVSDLIKKEDLDKITQRFEKIEEAIKHLSKQKLNVSTFEDYRKEIEACQKSASEFFETIKKGSSAGVNQKFNDAVSSLEKFKVPEYEVPDFSIPADEIKKEAETAKEAVSKVAEEVAKDTSKTTESVKEEVAKVTEEIKQELTEVEKLQKAFEKAQSALTKAEQDKETGLKNLEKVKTYDSSVQYATMSDLFNKLLGLDSESKDYSKTFKLLQNIYAGSDISARDILEQNNDLSSIIDRLYGEEGYKTELENNVKKAKKNLANAKKELREATKKEKAASKSAVAEQVSKEDKNDSEKETVKAKVEAEPEVAEDFQEKVQEEVDKKKVTAKVSVEEADDSKKEDKKSKKSKKSEETQENQTDNSNSDKSDEKESEGKATLEPKLSDTFKEDAKKLIDELGIEADVTLSPTLAKDFNDKVTNLIGETKEKDATSTEEVTVEVDSEEKSQDKANSTITLEPKLSDTFKEDAEQKVSDLKIKVPVNLELKKGKRSLASTTKAIEETLGNEFSSFDKISASIENVTTKIGEKNKAIQEEGGIVDRVSANEVTRFMGIRENIQRLINSIETLTKLNPYVEQLRSIGDSFNSMQINPDFVAGLKGIVSHLDKLGTKLESFGKKDINFDNLKTLSTIIPKLKISEKSVKAIDSLQDSLVDLSGVLRELQQADGGSYKFLDQLSNLVAKSKELEHLAKIISNYEKVANLTGEASPKQQIKDQYSAYINNLKEIIRLKKEGGNTDDSSRIKLLNNEIRSLSTKNQWIKKNITAMLQENPELETATKNEQNTVSVLQKKLETQKEINKINKADRQAANAESSDKNALTSYYKQLKDNLTEIKKLTSSLGRVNDEEGQSIIQDQIDAYNEENEKINSSIEAIYKRNSALQSSMTVEQNKIDILNDEIATTQKLNEENRKQRELAAQEALDKRTASQEVTEAAIREDSEGWKRALSVLQDNDYFKEARNGAASYLDLLYDIQSITAQIRRDERTGDEYVSYKFTDSLGSSLTVGADGQLLIQKSAVLDLKKAYTELISLKNNFDNISLKASKDEISTKQLKILQEYKDLLEQIGSEYRTNGWEEGSSWDKNAILAELDSGKIEKIIKSLQNLRSEYNALTVYEKGTSDTKIEKFLNKVYTFMGNNTKAAKLFRTELESLIGTTKAAGKDVNLDTLMDQFLKIENAAASSGMMGSSFLDDFKKQANYTLSNFLAQYLSIRDVIRYAQSAISTIEGLDYALLDLSKTAAMTESQLDDFYFSANDSAKALGVTTEEIIDLASSWSRLGYNTNEEATKMAEMTAKFAAISPGTSTDEAQTGMINVMKAWNLQADQMEDVIDKINVLGKLLPKRMVTYGALKCA